VKKVNVATPSRQALLNLLGAAILLLGLGAAAFIDLNAKPPSQDDAEDTALSPEDSRRNSHDMEMMGGKLVMLTDKGSQMWESLKSPEHVALTIAILSILIATGCFVVAARDPQD